MAQNGVDFKYRTHVWKKNNKIVFSVINTCKNDILNENRTITLLAQNRGLLVLASKDFQWSQERDAKNGQLSIYDSRTKLLLIDLIVTRNKRFKCDSSITTVLLLADGAAVCMESFAFSFAIDELKTCGIYMRVLTVDPDNPTDTLLAEYNEFCRIFFFFFFFFVAS